MCFFLFIFPRILRLTFPRGLDLLGAVCCSHQGGLSNNQNFPMENGAVGRFRAQPSWRGVPQRFQHLAALQSKFELSLSDLTQRRGIVGIIIGIFNYHDLGSVVQISCMSHQGQGLLLWQIIGKEGEIPMECLFLRHRWDPRAGVRSPPIPFSSCTIQPLPGPAAPPEPSSQSWGIPGILDVSAFINS